MIIEEQARQHLIGHIKWVNGIHGKWMAHRAAYADEFSEWEGSGERRAWALKNGQITGLLNETVRDTYPIEMNLERPWVTSILSSLYYRGIKVVVSPDEVPTKGESTEDRNKRTQAIRHLLNRFFAQPGFIDSSERMLTMSMMYRGGMAYQMHLLPEDERLAKASALDIVTIDALPPWECMWDRRTRKATETRYRGYLYPMPVEDVAAQWGMPDEIEPIVLPDVVAEGYRLRTSQKHEDNSYVYVLEFEDFTATKEVDGERVAGMKSVFVIDRMGPASPTMHRVAHGPMPFSWHDGSPASQLVPYIAEPLAEFPLDSVAPAETVRQLNAELNRTLSVIAGAFRRDSARVVLALKKAGVDEETLNKIMNARDLEFIEVEGSGPLSAMFEVLDWGQISDTLIKYRDMLMDGVDRTQLTADISRGKAGEYLSATEAAALVNYTETTIGRLKKRSDTVIGRLGQLYLRQLREAMDATDEKTVSISVGEDVYDITEADLGRRWKIQVIDTASTPTAAAEKLAEFQAALPVLMEMALASEPPTPDGAPGPAAQAFAAEAFDFLVELLDLPPQFALEALKAAAPPPVPPPEPVSLPVEPEALPLPQEGQVPVPIEGSPIIDAIVSTAEQGL